MQPMGESVHTCTFINGFGNMSFNVLWSFQHYSLFQEDPFYATSLISFLRSIWRVFVVIRNGVGEKKFSLKLYKRKLI